MSNQTSVMTAAGFPVSIHGIEYTAKPMTYNAIGEFEAAAVKWYLDRVEQSISGLTDDQKSAERVAASKVARNMFYGYSPEKYAPPEAFAAADLMRHFGRSDAGIVRFAFLMLRPRHPELTVETIAEWFSDQKVKYHTLAQLWRAPTDDDDDETDGEGEPKNA